MYPGRDLSVKGNGVMLIRFAVSMEPEMNSGIVVKPKKTGPGLQFAKLFLANECDHACRLHSSFQTDETKGFRLSLWVNEPPGFSQKMKRPVRFHDRGVLPTPGPT